MKENWKDYFYKGMAAFLTVAVSILFFFVIFRFEEVKHYIGMVTKILRPFIFGGVIAYLLSPVCNFFERHMEEAAKLDKKPQDTAEKYRRLFAGISILLSLLLFCLAIYALIAMVVPQVFSSILVLVDAMPGYIETISIWIEKLVEDNPFLLNYVVQYSEDILTSMQNFATSYLLPNINNIISGVSASLWTMVSAGKDFIIGLIVAVYLMNSRRMFARQAKLLIHAIFPHKDSWEPGREQRADWVIRETYILNSYLGGFIKGKLLDSLIIGLICMAFTGITEMPYAVLISVVIGVTNIIPFFGPFIGAIPTALLILMVSPIQCIYFIIFILVLQQFDGNILGPKILGDNTHLSSFWVLFAILLFGGLFGIVGMVIGVPIFAFFYQLMREWVRDRIKKQMPKEETK